MKEETKTEVVVIVNTENLAHKVQGFSKIGVDYQGRIFTNSLEYLTELARRNEVSYDEALQGVIMGYQSIQMTRVTPSTKAKLEEIEFAEVWKLYGTRVSGLARFVKEAVKLLVAAGLKEADLDEEVVAKLAEKLHAKDAKEKRDKKEFLASLVSDLVTDDEDEDEEYFEDEDSEPSDADLEELEANE
tara:strand:+ start:37591 stop:38154 length:564 start_codon:yes stop_codon:yes gene_type:complete